MAISENARKIFINQGILEKFLDKVIGKDPDTAFLSKKVFIEIGNKQPVTILTLLFQLIRANDSLEKLSTLNVYIRLANDMMSSSNMKVPSTLHPELINICRSLLSNVILIKKDNYFSR